MKACSKCDVIQPLDCFYKNKRYTGGYIGICKSCYKENTSRWYQNNKERYKATKDVWRANNKDKLADYQRKYKAENPEAFNEKHKRWVAKNRLATRSIAHKRRVSKKQNGVYEILPKHMRRLYASPCLYCGSIDRITADHVVPISRGGTHSIGNLVPACLRCNSSKNDKFITEWPGRK